MVTVDVVAVADAPRTANDHVDHRIDDELAEIGRGWTKTSQPIKFELTDSYGQFANIHLCQSGIVH